MAANFFDQFDVNPARVVPPAAAAGLAPPQEEPNFFDQFDEAPSPIDRALAARDAEVAAFQQSQQQRYEQQQAYASELIRQHPELGGPSSMQEPAPAVDPYNARRAPPLAPREAAPSQPLGSGFSAAFQLGLVQDEETKRKILADTLFPGDPDGIYRVGFDRTGQPVYVGDDNQLHKIASGTAAFGAQLLASSPEMIGAGIGSLGGPGTAALIASGMHGLKRSAAGLYYDEPQTTMGNVRDMAIEGATTLAGEGVGRGLNALVNSNRVVNFTPANQVVARAVRERLKRETGIDLDLAQASADRRLIALRAYAGRYPGESANLIQEAERRQNEQFHEAVDRIIGQVAAPTTAEAAGKQGINAAQAAIDAERLAAQARVDPLYQAAYAKGAVVTDPEVLQFFRHPEFRAAYRRGQDIARLEEKEAPTIMVRKPVPDMKMDASVPPQMSVKVGPAQAPHPAKAPALTRPSQPALEGPKPEPGTNLVTVDEAGNLVIPGTRQFKREKTPAAGYRARVEYTEEPMRVPDLRALDYTKRGLDAEIAQLKASGRREEARALLIQRRKFVQALDNLDIPEYQAARAAWKEEVRKNIKPLENGVVGALSRIKEPKAAAAAARIFGDPNLSPTMVLDAKKAIQPSNPAAWNQLVRTWIAHRYNQAQRVTQTGSELNPAGKLHQSLFGTPTARENTLAMLDEPTAHLLEQVMEAASRMASTPIAGSNTFRDTETAEMLKGLTGKGFQLWRAFTSPRDALRSMAERRAVEQSTLDIAEGILDPTQQKKLRVVLAMKPSTRRNVLLFNVLGAQTAKDYVKSRAAQGEDSHLIAEDEEEQ